MSLKKNREVNLLIRDTAGVSAAESYCLSRHANPKILRDIESPKEGQVQLFGDGRIDQALHEATEQAEGRIDVVIYAINASPQFPTGAVMTFLDALGDAVDRGVEVRVVLEKSDFDFNLNSMNAQAKSILEARGVEVRYEEVDTITHAKLLVADDVAVVATGNWSYGGFVQNHELAIWVVEESAVSALRTYAQVLFNQSQ
jgi:phosphatidylserine/phosphatidylglycerophosphate/cardiolipin synthase-like enzyme